MVCMAIVLVPKRWVVERTHAWIGRYRRNSKDYEKLTGSSECMIRLSLLSCRVGTTSDFRSHGPR